MNVLSLFDGISCGQIALNKLQIPINNYYASEIDRYAIAVTQYHYPKTIQLGDVCNIKPDKLPTIDILMGGSPCQGFSKSGSGLNFNDPRSRLFFEFVRILEEVKPTYFLLENVGMKKEWRDTITQIMKVEPHEINSSLVSAQNRFRLYWTNIPNIVDPSDKHIFIKDIIEHDKENKMYNSINYLKYSYVPINNTVNIVGNIYPKTGQNGNIYDISGKSKTLSAGTGIRGRGIGSSNAPKVKVNSHNCKQVGIANINGHDILKRIYDINGKCPTVNSMNGGNREPKIAINNIRWRRLSPLECERLQTIPDNYTLVPFNKKMMSDTQRYKMIGNGWTVDVITHILSFIKEQNNVE